MGGVCVSDSKRANGRLLLLALAFVSAVMVCCGLAGCSTSKTVEQSDGTQLTAKDSVNDYSWDELKVLSNAIATAPSNDDALQIAEDYHLCTEAGNLDGTQTKDITLSNGKTVQAQIIGFRHDPKSDGSSLSGITFLLCSPLTTLSANASGTTAGGWAQSDVRAWLSKNGLKKLPEDLRNQIVSVVKTTNNVGAGSTSASKTKDKLWLLSAVEITGKVEKGVLDDDENGSLAKLYNKEGSRYQLFQDCGVDCGRETNKKYDIGTLNQVLVKQDGDSPCMWWERSVYDGSSSDFYCVMTSGSPVGNATASYEYGVVPAFCI